MRVGIMQPYFFPYLGYFDLIRNADRWIVFDTAQYIRHGWVNRNRILRPDQGWQYVVVPLHKHSHTAPISAIEVNRSQPWRERLLGQLAHYRRRAPYYEPTIDLVRECVFSNESKLSRLNVLVLDKVCHRLGIPFRRDFFSDLGLEIGPVDHAGEWALRISEALGADEYINPPGGEDLFDRAAFARSGISLKIRHPPCMEYSCRGYAFEKHLSIIDVLMWNPPEQIAQFLDHARF